MSVIRTDTDGRAEIVDPADAGKRSRARALADAVKGRTASAGQAVRQRTTNAGQAVRQRTVNAGQAAKQRPAVPAAGLLAVAGAIAAVVLRQRRAAKTKAAASRRWPQALRRR
jgi:hypothetical protein